jgi:tRNA pseudouridine55 synthase
MQSQVWTILRCLGDKLLNKDGILLIDKPAGFTSHDVVARVRKLVGTRRVGHTGTLDPFATGLLVICLNRATRLVQFLTGEDKEYQAVARLGFATDTGDLTGQPLSAPSRDIQFTREELAAANVFR